MQMLIIQLRFLRIGWHLDGIRVSDVITCRMSVCMLFEARAVPSDWLYGVRWGWLLLCPASLTKMKFVGGYVFGHGLAGMG
jgi:hypothetical protein